MKPLHRLPLDEWFDDVPHPYDTWPMATDNSYENPRPEEEVAENITMHEKMYRLAVEKHSPWKGGGSEEWQESKPG
tara:strand:+ start:6266 stop:6493 length:228 start_codon:yes stop_codon:yes gene_type:complete